MVWIFVLACCYPIFKRSGERRRFIVKRGGSVLAICWRILKVSRRNYCNYYNLKIVRESWFFKLSEKPKVEASLRGHNKNIKMTSSPARPLCWSFEQTQWEGARPDHPCSSSVGALSSFKFYGLHVTLLIFRPLFASIRCTNEWECWNVKIQFSRDVAFFQSHLRDLPVVSSVEFMLKFR